MKRIILKNKINKILNDSKCLTIETNICDSCDKRIKEIRKLLNKCKG